MPTGVSNGQNADENTFNDSFMARNGDTDTTGKVDLVNADGVSGGSITNVQRNINALASALGISTDQVYNYLITWASNAVGSSSSSAKDKIDALVAKFLNLGGHDHSGIDGEGPKIKSTDLDDFNNLWLVPQSMQKTGVSGASTDLSIEFTGKTPGGTSILEGVITDPPTNRVEIVDPSTGTFYEDAGGQKVYARLTYAASVWTLSYYTNEAGVETAYSFASPSDILFIYREVFSSETRPTVGAFPTDFGTLDMTADVVDAAVSQRGVVSTGAQVFGGGKKLNDYLALGVADVATATSIVAVPSAKSAIRFTGSTFTAVEGIAAGIDGQEIWLYNDSTQRINFLHESSLASAADRLVNHTAEAINIDQGDSIAYRYLAAKSRWVQIAGSNYVQDNQVQTITGGKTFDCDVRFLALTITITGDVTSLSTARPFISLFGTTAANIRGLSSGLNGKILEIYNGTTQTITLKHEDAGASVGDRMSLPGAVDLPLLTGEAAGVVYDPNIARWVVRYRPGGGGSGGSLAFPVKWFTDDSAPVEGFDGSSLLKTFEFEKGMTQYLYANIRVPAEYTPGTQIQLKLPFYVDAASGTTGLNYSSVLVRTGTDSASSNTNQETGSVTEAVSSGVLKNETIDLTDASGEVNGVAVSAGDLLKVVIDRDSGDAVDGSLFILAEASEVVIA